MEGMTVAALRDHIIKVRESCMALNDFVEQFVQSSGLNANDVINLPLLFGNHDKSAVEIDGFMLSTDQLKIFNKVMNHLRMDKDPIHMFVSGPSGTGKSLLLKALRNAIRAHFHSEEESCIVTTFTFTGARSIDGATINSHFRIPVAANNDRWKDSPQKNSNFENKLKKTKVVLVDGINFIDASLIYSMDQKLRGALNGQKPFGGVSVVVFGDLYQMTPFKGSPIWKGSTTKSLWSLMKLEELARNEKVVDQDDLEMLDILRIGAPYLVQAISEKLKSMCEMKGETMDDVVEELKSLKLTNPDRSFAVLTNTNNDLDKINEKILHQLGSRRMFKAQDCVSNLRGSTSTYNLVGKYDKKDLELAIGSQIMLTTNYKKLSYGTAGRVTSFTDDVITVKFPTGHVPLTRCGWSHTQHGWKQFPLALSEVFTFHNCQEITVDGVIIFGELEERNAYTALSRARSLKLCRVTPIHLLDNLSKRNLDEEKEEMTRMRNNC